MRQLICTYLFMAPMLVKANSFNIDSIQVHEFAESPFGESSLIFNAIELQEPISYDSGELLDYFLGVNRIQNGGFSSLPSIQGLSDDRIKIKIDGMDLISSCANHMNAPLAYATPANIDTMSVVAGLSSVSQGGDNIGGVIKITSNIIDFSSSTAWHVNQRAQTFFKSNNDTLGLNYLMTAKNHDTSLRYYGSGVEANNYSAGSAFKAAGLAANGRGYLSADEVGSTAFKNTNHQVNFAKKIGNDLYDFQVGYHYSPYESFANQRMDSVENKSLQTRLAIKSNYHWGNAKTAFYLDDTQHRHNFGPDKQFIYNSAPGMPMQSEGFTTGLNLDAEIYLNNRDTLKTGIEMQYYRLDDTFDAVPGSVMMQPNTFVNINNGQRDRVDFFAQWDRIYSERWLTSAGIRYGFVRTDADQVQGYSTTNNMMTQQVTDSDAFNQTDRTKHDHNIDLSLLAKFTPSKQANIEFGYTMKSRSPNLYQRYTWSTWAMVANMNNLYGDGNGYVGNINLDSEIAHKIGFLYNYEDAEKTWVFKMNPYYSYITDYIDAKTLTTRADGFRTMQFVNQDAYLYGIDALAGTKLWNDEAVGTIALLAKLNYQRGKNKDNNTNLYNLMPINFSLALNHRLGQWENTIASKLVAKKNKVDTERLERQTAGYMVVDLKSSYLWNTLRFNVGIDNLFDKNYDDPLGGEYLGQGKTMAFDGSGLTKSAGSQVPAMGRTFNISLTYTF